MACAYRKTRDERILIEKFLSLVFGRARGGWICLLGLGPRTLPVWFEVSQLSAAARRAREMADEGFDVYVGCGVRGVKKDGRGSSPDVIAVPGFWADIDYGLSGHKKEEPRPRDLAETLRALADFPRPPSLIVASGHGVQPWWLGIDPWDFVKDGTSWQVAEAHSKRFQQEIREAWAKRGWGGVDETADLARILRVPGTKNYKNKDDVKDVMILFDEGPRYRFKDLVDLSIKVSSSRLAKAPLSPRTRQKVAEAVELVTVSEGPFGEAALSEVELVRLKRLVRPESRELFRRACRGEPIALPRNRDPAFRDLAGAVAFALGGNSLELERYGRFLRPCYDATVADAPEGDPPEPIEKMIDQFARSCADAKAANEAQARVVERLMGPEPTALQPDVARQAQASIESETAQVPYNEVELDYIANKLRCTRDELKKRWIIQIGRSYFVYSRGDYKGPIIRESLNHLPYYLNRAPIEWVEITENAKGEEKVKVKIMSKIVAEYGTPALQIIADMSIQHSYFDPESETFFQAICPLRRLEPQYDADVDRWLRALGGPLAEKVLDWVATVTMLDKQNCAIYFSGPPGIGKNLFAQALARLWGSSATPLENVLGSSFNADIARCPLIFADEQIYSSNPRLNVSAVLRSLIGSQQRTYMQKFVQNADLIGAVRLVIAGNNDRLLSSEDDLGADDYKALGARFLHVQIPKEDQEAAKILRSIGGDRLNEWVKGDVVARHALWLRDHREVLAGERFLVEGSPTELHQSLVTEGMTNGLVCEWITRYLDNPKPFTSTKFKSYVVVGNGELLINTSALADGWIQYINPRFAVPTTARLGRILTNLAVGQRRVMTSSGKFLRYHVVNLEFIFHWAESNQIGDLDHMRAVVNAKQEEKKA